jgi:glyoxylase-like metal-dependent hydrolase (beta-lactamase superfamily II)
MEVTFMEIKAVRLYENGFMTEDFAFGGSAEKSNLDENKTYPSSLQNYVIDTGKEVILVDTGIPEHIEDTPPKPGQKIYQGTRINTYLNALHVLGYEPEQVNKIVLTHKHPDHSGELKRFPNAKIYLSAEEADALKLEGENIIRVAFKDGPYHNFDKSEKIAPDVYFISAPGHTKGNGIVIVEKDELFYMMHGDVTYTDAALVKNSLSVVFEDKEAAATTLEQIRTFIQNNPTVYLSTHTPEAITNLQEKKIMQI